PRGDGRDLFGEASADRGADPPAPPGHEHHVTLHPRAVVGLLEWLCHPRGRIGGGGAGRTHRPLLPSLPTALTAPPATPRDPARSPCAPRSRPSGRCARRGGRSAS